MPKKFAFQWLTTMFQQDSLRESVGPEITSTSCLDPQPSSGASRNVRLWWVISFPGKQVKQSRARCNWFWFDTRTVQIWKELKNSRTCQIQKKSCSKTSTTHQLFDLPYFWGMNRMSWWGAAARVLKGKGSSAQPHSAASSLLGPGGLAPQHW